jgi:predicted nucleic acid-binding Zn ribbon protein
MAVRKTNEQSLKEVIGELLKAYHIEDKYFEMQLVNTWEKVLGKTIARYTREVYVKNKVLYVRLESSVLRSEMSFAKEKIIQMLNDECGKKVIEDMVLR